MLRQGLTILTWSSLTLESFFQEVDSVLNMFNQLLKKVKIDKYEKTTYMNTLTVSNSLITCETPLKGVTFN